MRGRQLMALVRKDLRLELRTRETIVAMVLFAIVMMVILQFGFGTRDDDLTRFVGGLMWVTLAFTAVLGVITVLVLPLVGDLLGMTLSQYGTLAGMTVYAVPQVLAATVPVGPEAVEMGTLVKLVRVLMLGPVCLVLAVIVHRLGAKGGSTAKLGFGKMVPWFIIGFMGMLAVRSLGLIPDILIDPIKLLAGSLTTIAMAALGLGVDVRVVARAGGRVTAAVTCSLVMLAVISVVLIRALGVA